MLLPLLSYAAVFLASVLLFLAAYSGRGRRLPPGPLSLPVIGHLHLIGPAIHRSFHALSARHGPLMLIRLGSVPAVVASSPEVAREMLKAHEGSFSTRPHSAAIDHLTYGAAFAFAEYGPYWRFVKKLSVTRLLGQQNLARFAPTRASELRGFLRNVQKCSEEGAAVNVTEELLKLMNNVISQTMMSIRCSGGGSGGEGEAASEVAREVTRIFGEFNVSDFIRVLRNWDVQGFRKRFVKIRSAYDELIERIIAQREEERRRKREEKKAEEEEEKDFLGMLLDVMEGETSEVKIGRVHVKALILVRKSILACIKMQNESLAKHYSACITILIKVTIKTITNTDTKIVLDRCWVESEPDDLGPKLNRITLRFD